LAFLLKRACSSWIDCICNFFVCQLEAHSKIHINADIPLVINK
jgi:hypothetical protein